MGLNSFITSAEWLLALIFIILINVSRSYVSNQSDQAGAEAGLSTLATTVTGPAEVGMSDPGDVSLSAIAEGGIVAGGHNLTVSSTSVTPDSYQLESGASRQITIEGANLSSAYSVYLTNASGDTAGDCTNLNVAGDTQLTCTIPTTGISAGDYTIHVVTQETDDNGVTIGFTYIEPVLTNTSVDNYGSSVGHVQVDWDTNMIPVTYDNGHWVALTSAEIQSNPKSWYDYVNKIWANAVTVKKEKLSTYKNQSNRVVVQEDDVLGYWVYVPRYAYLVKRRDAVDTPVQAQNFQIRFETSADSTKVPRSTCSKSTYPVSHKNYLSCSNVSQTYGAATGTAWATHPAFNWNDKKLNGIWVAKFEMTGTRTEPTVKPNSRSNVLEDVGILYTMAKNIGYSDSQNIGGLSITGIKSNYHSLAQATSHLIKNTEWGAASYLAASQYGAGYNGMMPNTAEAPGGTDADGDGKDSSWDELTGISSERIHC